VTKKYRSRIQIYADILAELEHGEASITQLLYRANLSHTRLVKYLNNLIESGLVRRVESEGSIRYVLTSKGLEFLREYRKFIKFAKAFGIEV